MSDNKDTVKSKISMDLKNRNNKKAVDTAPLSETSKEAVTTDTYITSEQPIREASHSTTATKEPSGSHAYHDQLSPSKQVIRKPIAKKIKVFFFAIWLIPVLMIAASVLFSHYEDSAHYYYVESTIAPPSEVETSTSALVLGSCVIDFTKKATPGELTQMVFDEYGYQKNDSDFVQTIVNTGCDTSLSLPKIKNGSALKAMF